MRLPLARDRLPGAGKVAEARQQAFEAYERAGLPHRRIEDWKYTDLRVLMREVLPLAAAPDAAALKRAAAALKLHAIDGARRLVLVDGVFAPSLSETGNLEKGLGIRTLREVLEAGDAKAAGATARAGKSRPHGGAEQRHDDGRPRDRGRRWRRADAAFAHRPYRQRRDAFGDVHALPAEARQGRQRDAGGKLHRRRGRQSLSGP